LKEVLKCLHVLKRCKLSSYSYRQLRGGNDFKVTEVNVKFWDFFPSFFSKL